jgi:tetrahydromethanopterin S-methyltransferase subunit G
VFATYEHACSARGHPAAPVSPADVEAIRARLDDLTEKWGKVALNASLTVKL